MNTLFKSFIQALPLILISICATLFLSFSYIPTIPPYSPLHSFSDIVGIEPLYIAYGLIGLLNYLILLFTELILRKIKEYKEGLQ